MFKFHIRPRISERGSWWVTSGKVGPVKLERTRDSQTESFAQGGLRGL